MATREGEEFKRFLGECRQVGLADMKALEAAWDQYAALVPESARGEKFREDLMKLLLAGAKLARFEEQVEKEQNNGR